MAYQNIAPSRRHLYELAQPWIAFDILYHQHVCVFICRAAKNVYKVYPISI
jgi:hypothetical protein